MSKAVLCAGRLYCDLIFTDTPRLPTLGTEVFAGGVSMRAGGGAFITAATLAAVGTRAAQFSILPAAPFGATVVAELTSHNVSTRLCTQAPPFADPQITVAMTCGKDRAFLTRAFGAAIPPFEPNMLSEFSHLHIGELSTLEENPTLVDIAHSCGLTVSLDCGWQDNFRPEVHDLIAAVDVFLPNQREVAALLEIGIPETCAELTVIKNGEDGARAGYRTEPGWVNEPTKPVTVLDATGAGDAFNGGFLSEWLKGSPLRDALRVANACGAATVQTIGGAADPAAFAKPLAKEPGMQEHEG